MAEDGGRSVVINIPKVRCYDNKYKNVTEKKRNIIKPAKTKTSSSNNRVSLPVITFIKPLPAATFNKEEILLPYLRYSKKQERDRFKERLGVGLYEHYKVTHADLRQRLHVDDPVDDTRGITDLDPTFFTCVKSSTLSSYVAAYKSLKYLFNSQLRLRQEVGYRYDCMMNMDTKYKKEQEVYNASVKRCTKQVKHLDEFISDDYKKSMAFLSNWENLKTALNNKNFELQCLATEKFAITSKIVGLDYRYGLQQKYGRFLYYLSPPSWRLKNRNFARSIEIEARGFDFGISSEEDTFNVIFENLKKECESGLVQPVLYFEHPEDLMNIFDGIEQQHLHHFTHVARLAPHANFLKKGIKLFKDIINQESAGVVANIKEFEKMFKFCEEQCSQLENKFYKILNNLFYESVGAPEVLKFQLHLEFCYAKVYNEKSMNLGVKGTAKALEDFYMQYSKKLDSMTSENITTAVKQSVEAERRKFKMAKIAARELRQFERLERTLLRAYAPLRVHQSQYTFSSKSKRRRQKKVIINTIPTQHDDNRKRLTDTEIEYLSLFTDWTDKEDPAMYLRSLSMQDDEMKRKSISYMK